MFCFIELNMSRNERHRSDKRTSSSRARSKGILKFKDFEILVPYNCVIIYFRITKKRIGKCC